MSGASVDDRVRRTRTAAAVAACVALLAAVAQAQPLPAIPTPPPTPPAFRAPPIDSHSPSLSLPTPRPTGDLFAPPGPPPQVPPSVTLTEPVAGPPLLGPQPGSAEDDVVQEVKAREQFRYGTWRGGELTALPNSLLWEPGLAVKKDPRFMASLTSMKNYRSEYTLETQIGNTIGLYRFKPGGDDTSYQLDIFGVVQTRLSPDDLLLTDYRFGVPLTIQRGWWQAKIAYEHTSDHLGDELIARTGRFDVRSYSRDEVVLGLGRFILDDFRVYATYGYALQYVVPDKESSTKNRSRFDTGFEYYRRCPTGFNGTPFVAANVEFRGDQDRANIDLQVGWMWRNPYQRLGMARIYAEYYTGNSPYGQNYNQHESYGAVGLAFDY